MDRLPVGIHANIPELVYHSDPAFEISASSSVLKAVFQQSLAHARDKHPRLNAATAPGNPTDAMAWGTILHSMILGTPAPYVALKYSDYRTKAAQEARDAVYADDLIPILEHKLIDISDIAWRTKAHIEKKYPRIHEALNDPETLKEATVIGHVNSVLCRGRYDILPPKRYGFSVDLKFTGLTAAPETWSRKTIHDHLFQAELYPRLMKVTRGDAPEFQFLVIETGDVAASSLHAMAPSLRELARGRLDIALAKWKHAMETNHWPDYPSVVHYSEAPNWMVNDDEDRALREEAMEMMA